MTYDVFVDGGSYAGLAAALQLGRARRRVLVVDAGERRNATAKVSHGYLTRDGEDPAKIIALAREELERYPSIEIVKDRVTEAKRTGDTFTIETAEGGHVQSSRLIIASGVKDELPDIPGVAERWGSGVVPCPYCHAFESAGRRLGVIGERTASAEMAAVIRDWGTTTLFTQAAFEPETEVAALLRRRGVAIERKPIVEMLGRAPLLEAIRLADDRSIPIDLAFLVPPTMMASTLAAELGCEFDDALTGPVLRTDHNHQTTVRGVFAAGDASMPAASIALAISTGAAAGIATHHSLVLEGVGGDAP